MSKAKASASPGRPKAARARAARPAREPAVPAEVTAAVGTLGALIDRLEPFKQASPEAREALRRGLSSRDVGYLIALLKALHDEDAFQEWVLYTRFTREWKRGL